MADNPLGWLDDMEARMRRMYVAHGASEDEAQARIDALNASARTAIGTGPTRTYYQLRDYVRTLQADGLFDAATAGALIGDLNAAEDLGESPPALIFDPAGMSPPQLVRDSARAQTTRGRGYIDNYNPQRKTLALLAAVQGVLEEYREHWPLTVRQIFYRLVGAHGFDKSEQFYGTLCHHLANARRARVIPFSAIRDDGVSTVNFEHYADADAFIQGYRAKASRFRRDLMARQGVHIEVWCEAAGMIMQLAKVTERYSIPVYSSSGFDSVTAKFDLAQRICTYGIPALILHLGDYDPSGESMFKVIGEDVGEFVRKDRHNAMVTANFQRVALTSEQVSQYSLPTAPPKKSDSRTKAWAGETCQLEALAPDQIAAMLEDAILSAVNVEQMDADRTEETRERSALTKLLLSDFTASRKTGDDAPGA